MIAHFVLHHHMQKRRDVTLPIKTSHGANIVLSHLFNTELCGVTFMSVYTKV